MINAATQGSNSVNGKENTSTLLIFKVNQSSVRMAQLYEVCFSYRRKLGCRFKSWWGYFQFCFCFFFFHHIFTLWLVSVYSHCWPFLALRDFCDNIFLLLLFIIIIIWSGEQGVLWPMWIDQFQYIKIHPWLRGLEESNKWNVLFITVPQDDFFCFTSPSLIAKYEF